jgi:HlyD family secretion protein
VRINPTVVQNVVTYDAVVSVHDSTGRLLPGMTAQVTIAVGARTHVPAVPIAGVLYRPLAAPSGGGGVGGFGGGGGGGFQSSGGAPGAQAVAGAPGSQVTVWVLQDGRPVPRRVIIGLSDTTSVEIASGPLNPGDPVIVAQRRGGARGAAPNTTAAASTTATPTAGPGTNAPASRGAGAPAGANGSPGTNGARTFSGRTRTGAAPVTPGQVATDPAPAAAPASGPTP